MQSVAQGCGQEHELHVPGGPLPRAAQEGCPDLPHADPAQRGCDRWVGQSGCDRGRTMTGAGLHKVDAMGWWVRHWSAARCGCDNRLWAVIIVNVKWHVHAGEGAGHQWASASYAGEPYSPSVASGYSRSHSGSAAFVPCHQQQQQQYQQQCKQYQYQCQNQCQQYKPGSGLGHLGLRRLELLGCCERGPVRLLPHRWVFQEATSAQAAALGLCVCCMCNSICQRVIALPMSHGKTKIPKVTNRWRQ